MRQLFRQLRLCANLIPSRSNTGLDIGEDAHKASPRRYFASPGGQGRGERPTSACRPNGARWCPGGSSSLSGCRRQNSRACARRTPRQPCRNMSHGADDLTARRPCPLSRYGLAPVDAGVHVLGGEVDAQRCLEGAPPALPEVCCGGRPSCGAMLMEARCFCGTNSSMVASPGSCLSDIARPLDLLRR